MTRVKICGITSLEDAMAAVRSGADALGFIFAESPRRVQPDQVKEIISQLPPLVQTIGVFVETPVEKMEMMRISIGLDLLQHHGEEKPEIIARLGRRVIKVLRVGDKTMPNEEAYPTATLLLDTYVPNTFGGTGKRFDWHLAKPIARRRPIILAGGLTPENVKNAIKTVRPYAVDVSSGVESEPGRKDHGRMEEFIRRAKELK